MNKSIIKKIKNLKKNEKLIFLSLIKKKREENTDFQKKTNFISARYSWQSDVYTNTKSTVLLDLFQ